MAAAMVLAVALVAMAAGDLRGPISRRRWREVTVYAGLWLAGATGAVLETAGVELPSLSRLFVHLLRPVARWMP